MKLLPVLVLCISCCLGADLERRYLERLQRELEERLIARELSRDERQEEDVFEDDVEERNFDELDDPEGRELDRETRQSKPIDNCVVGDIVFVLDSSGSISLPNWQLALNFVNQIIDNLKVGPLDTHVALITYGNRAHNEFYLTNFTSTDTTAMKNAVKNAKFLDENTNTSGGLWMAHRVMLDVSNGARDKAPRIIIVITDGASTYDKEKTIPYANEAKQAGIMVVVLGVGNLTSTAELTGMASVSKTGQVLKWEVGGYEMLTPIKDTLANVACGIIPVNTTVSPCTSAPANVTVCPATSCSNTCQIGFAPDKNFCLTCVCLPPPKCP